jgi:HlyD family secretion protein
MSLKKILIIAGVVIVAVAIVAFTIVRAQSGYTKVVTGKVVRQDLSSIVSGTGQIKPKTYVNIGATAFGRITHLNVVEGDRVKKGQVLATIENVQASSGVEAQKASIASSKTDVNSYIAAEHTAAANIERGKADLEQKKLDYERAQGLYKEQLIAKQDYDAKKAAYDTAIATLAQYKAAEAQARAQTESARGHVDAAQATLRSNIDSLNKTISIAPFDGIVTNVPMREGETVVVGIQNAEGSTLMTEADMSVVTAEVKVDETDIVNVKIGQPADVTVDALPGKIFKGHVTLVGDQALLRSTGIATSQSTSGTEEAKDFKVVVTLDGSPTELRPGLSTTAKITTAHKEGVLVLPIQALTMYVPGSEDKAHVEKTAAPAAKPAPPVQGVFVLNKDHGKLKTKFVPVTTGITGATDIEVLTGVKEGDEIVLGPYKTLRVLKSGALVKPDNTPAPVKDGESTS